jgi:hypothetical protein
MDLKIAKHREEGRPNILIANSKREKLVRERGAGSGERGAGKKRAESRDFIFKIFEILTNMARQPITVGNKCLTFY